jgi:hypothetical protein
MATMAETTAATTIAYSIKFCPFLLNFILCHIAPAPPVLQITRALLSQPKSGMRTSGYIVVPFEKNNIRHFIPEEFPPKRDDKPKNENFLLYKRASKVYHGPFRGVKPSYINLLYTLG